MLILYLPILLTLTVYSFVLVDLNLTLINSPLWEVFRKNIIQIGYYQRNLSALIYILLVLSLFLLHKYAKKNHKKIKVIKLAVIISGILFFSYPFLSHDIFNYMFDAKILTFYHRNPYITTALSFPSDPWVRFMHWVHRPYPYGPTFLPLTLIPSFFSFGKFIFSFFLFKAFFICFYITTVYVLNKLNSRWAVSFATHPLVLIEGLVNSHNDLTAISLAFIGAYFIFKEKKVWGRIFFLISSGIKYTTLPFVLLSTEKKSRINLIVSRLLAIILVYLSFFQEIQPWYFLTLLVLIPFYEDAINRMEIFFAGLLFSYYPYIAYGEWTQASNITMKHIIILVFLVLCLLYNISYGWISSRKTLRKA